MGAPTRACSGAVGAVLQPPRGYEPGVDILCARHRASATAHQRYVSSITAGGSNQTVGLFGGGSRGGPVGVQAGLVLLDVCRALALTVNGLVSRRRLSATTESNAACPVLWNRRVERVARPFTGTFLHEGRVRTASHLSERTGSAPPLGSNPVPDPRKKRRDPSQAGTRVRRRPTPSTGVRSMNSSVQRPRSVHRDRYGALFC